MNTKIQKTDNYVTPSSYVIEVGCEGILCTSPGGYTDNFDEIDNPYFG